MQNLSVFTIIYKYDNSKCHKACTCPGCCVTHVVGASSQKTMDAISHILLSIDDVKDNIERGDTPIVQSITEVAIYSDDVSEIADAGYYDLSDNVTQYSVEEMYALARCRIAFNEINDEEKWISVEELNLVDEEDEDLKIDVEDLNIADEDGDDWKEEWRCMGEVEKDEIAKIEKRIENERKEARMEEGIISLEELKIAEDDEDD